MEKPESETVIKQMDQPVSDRDTKQVDEPVQSESELIGDKVEKVDLPDKHYKNIKKVCFSAVETKVIKEPSSSEGLDDTLEIYDLVIDESQQNLLVDLSGSPILHIHGDVELEDKDLDECPPGGDIPLEDIDLFDSTPPCSQMPHIDPYKKNCEKASNR